MSFTAKDGTGASVQMESTGDGSATPYRLSHNSKVADGDNATLGAQADSAATSDTGTFSMVALWKRALQKLTMLSGQLPSALTGSGNLKVANQEALPAGTNIIGQVEVTDGSNVLGTSGHPVRTDPTGTTPQPVSGTVTAQQSTAANLQAQVEQLASVPNTATLQSAASTAGNGTSLVTNGMAAAVLTVAITGTATVNFEGTEDGSTWVALNAVQLGTNNIVQTTTASGDFEVSCAGLQDVRARISGVTGTPSVTVTGHAVPVAGRPHVVNANVVNTPTVTSNAGTNLNTSALALESGGNLATLAGIVSSSKAAVKLADGDDSTLGAKADSAATSDTGTFSLIALFKRLLQGITTLQGQLPSALTSGGYLKTAPQTQVGAANLATGQVTTSGTAGTLVSSRTTRRSVTVKNVDSTITVYVGPATVTTSNGFEIKAGESKTFTWTGTIQVIAASGTPVVHYADEYD